MVERAVGVPVHDRAGAGATIAVHVAAGAHEPDDTMPPIATASDLTP